MNLYPDLINVVSYTDQLVYQFVTPEEMNEYFDTGEKTYVATYPYRLDLDRLASDHQDAADCAREILAFRDTLEGPAKSTDQTIAFCEKRVADATVEARRVLQETISALRVEGLPTPGEIRFDRPETARP